MLFAWLTKPGEVTARVPNDTLALVPLEDNTIEMLKAMAQALHVEYVKGDMQPVSLTWLETDDGDSYTAYETSAIRAGSTLRPFFLIRVIGEGYERTPETVGMGDIPF